MTSPSRPAGLSGDAGPTPDPFAALSAYTAVCRAVEIGDRPRRADVLVLLDDYRSLRSHAAVERVGQLEALVRDGLERFPFAADPMGDRLRGHLAAAVETLEKGTPDA